MRRRGRERNESFNSFFFKKISNSIDIIVIFLSNDLQMPTPRMRGIVDLIERAVRELRLSIS